MRIKDVARVQDLFSSPRGLERRNELAELIAASGALLAGHFRLQSGLHAGYFLRVGQLAFEPKTAARIAAMLRDVVPMASDARVLCAETAARYLGIALRDSMGGTIAIARVDDRRHPCAVLRGGDTLEGAREIVVVTDVLTTGDSIAPLVDMARQSGAASVKLVAIACLGHLDMQRMLAHRGLEGGCLLQGQWTSYRDRHCALCQEGLPLVPAFEFN